MLIPPNSRYFCLLQEELSHPAEALHNTSA